MNSLLGYALFLLFWLTTKKREPEDEHRYCVSSVQSGQDQSAKPLDVLLTNNQNIKLSTEPHAELHNKNKVLSLQLIDPQLGSMHL